MSSPFDHHHHNHHNHHHHSSSEEEEERRRIEAERHHYSPYPQPPPHYPPPGQHHSAYPPNPYPPPQHYPPPDQHYYAPPAYPPSPYGSAPSDHGSHGGYVGPAEPPPSHHGAPSNLRTVRIFPKAGQDYSLSIRDGQVILAPSNHRDEYQHWIKDEKYSVRVKDEGLPCFALVNKVTGQAIKHSIGATHPVRLIPYNSDYLDESILWTESKDTGENYRCIRMVNNIRLNFDAFHGDKDHGGVRDGTTIVLWEWLQGDNQRWKIIPY